MSFLLNLDKHVARNTCGCAVVGNVHVRTRQILNNDNALFACVSSCAKMPLIIGQPQMKPSANEKCFPYAMQWRTDCEDKHIALLQMKKLSKKALTCAFSLLESQWRHPRTLIWPYQRVGIVNRSQLLLIGKMTREKLFRIFHGFQIAAHRETAGLSRGVLES